MQSEPRKQTKKTLTHYQTYCFSSGLHAAAVGSTVAVQQEDSGFKSWAWVFLHGVCMFSPFMPGTPASSHYPTVRIIGLSKLPLGGSACMPVFSALYVSVLSCGWTGDLSRVYPPLTPLTL
ncbi:hypothetical protein XENORESO_005291 [Xenotaenia resolanae]|uniref:Uncharacterized protein n=1 Tax=Xenotaenia resolanae TaxID=208358 RepID=A0ABV0VVU2_9TELE